MSVSYAVGIVHYQTYADLRRCLDALAQQTWPPDLVLVVDVDPDPAQQSPLRSDPSLAWRDIENRGFAGGANAALKALDEQTESEFFLLLNPDVYLEPDFAQALLSEMRRQPRTALGSGKLLRRDGTIDSAGIILPRNRRPRDRGSDEVDRGRYDRVERVFGVSGAAMMLRRSALAELAIDGEVFDEDFFLYHEDTDLAWRAGLLTWGVLYVPQARAQHERRWQRQRRFEIPISVRRHSFKNHYLQLIKNESLRGVVIDLPILASWELLRLGYALLRDPAIFPAYRDAWKLRARIWKKRKHLQAAIRRATSTNR